MLLGNPASAVTFILTSDRKRADGFYTGVLGLPVPSDDGFASVFDLGRATLRITEIPGHKGGDHPVLGWDVGDIRAAVAKLGSSGVTMIVYPGMGQDEHGIWTSPDGKAQVVFFHDPDRNVLSLTQR